MQVTAVAPVVNTVPEGGEHELLAIPEPSVALNVNTPGIDDPDSGRRLRPAEQLTNGGVLSYTTTPNRGHALTFPALSVA